MMMIRVTALLCLPVFVLTAKGASLYGSVIDTSGGAIVGARIAAYNRVGIVGETATNAAGAFELNSLPGDLIQLVVTAEGFATKTTALPAGSSLEVRLEIAPASDSIRVPGTVIDTPASEQASSVSIVTGEQMRSRNQAPAFEFLRYIPGAVISQTGQWGGNTSLFLRGGDSNYALVEVDGVPVNSFSGGGSFDFSQIPADSLDRIEVVRGAQSAVYGSYANSGVVNFVTRSGEDGPAIDIVADGGSHDEHREAISGSGMIDGFGLGFSLSRIDDNNEVPNSDWRNENVLLHVNRNWQRQSISASGNFNSNEEGSPGPYGSDPEDLYPGLNLVSRDKNNTSDYMFHYQADVSSRVRAELFGGFYLNNSFYISPYGNSFNKDIRGQAEARSVVSVTHDWTMSAGVVWAREEMKNTYVTDNSFSEFPLRRDEVGIYWENRFQFRNLYVQAGVRGDLFNTLAIPAFDDPYSPRPEIPANSYGRVDPKIAAGYSFASGTRLHASFGTGIRPPGGFDLAFTTNPALKPERTISGDVGVAQSLLHGRIVLDGTFFDTSYTDLIVSLGGSLATLSQFTTDNLANARVRGTEITAQARPARWISVSANYTFLDTAVLALDHSSGVAQSYYTVGQQLPRRPPHSGSFGLALSRGRFSGGLTGYIRGETLDVEPNYGASEGFFTNPGYSYLVMTLSVALAKGVSAFGTVNNLSNEHYEEVFGFPSPRLNFVTGLKWSWRGREI